MKTIQGLFLLLVLAVLVMPQIVVHAAVPQDPPNYCWPVVDPEKCLGVGQAILVISGELSLNIAVGAAKVVDGLIWLLDRAAAFIFDITVKSDWLLSMKDQLLTSLASIMPSILRDVVMGNTGLMYIAMALAGVLMVLPLVGADQVRLVRPERVLLWGMLLAVLFLGGSSSATGYDLINMVEGLRLNTMTTIIGTAENPADKLIMSPMMATSREFDSNNLLELPSAFESRYFPEIEHVEVTIINIPAIGPVNALVETKDSARNRAALAGSSLFFAFISLLGGYTLLMFAITFAFLGVAALQLILFLFAALPLGFFEFGNLILKNIIEKYMQIVVFSLGIAVFVRWVIGWISGFPEASDVQAALNWASLLLVVVGVLHVILGGAFNVLISSTQVFSGSVQAVFGAAGMSALGSGMGALTNGFGTPAANTGAAGGSPQPASPSAAASLVNGALSAVGFHATSSVLREPEAAPRRRGDIFQDNTPSLGGEGDNHQPQSTTRSSQASSGNQREKAEQGQPADRRLSGKQNPQYDQQPAREPDRVALFNRTNNPPSPVEAETSLQSLASREGRKDEQIQTIQTVAQQPITEQQAIHNLAETPGFENSTDEAIQQALRSAQVLGPAPQPERRNPEERV